MNATFKKTIFLFLLFSCFVSEIRAVGRNIRHLCLNSVQPILAICFLVTVYKNEFLFFAIFGVAAVVWGCLEPHFFHAGEMPETQVWFVMPGEEDVHEASMLVPLKEVSALTASADWGKVDRCVLREIEAEDVCVICQGNMHCDKKGRVLSSDTVVEIVKCASRQTLSDGSGPCTFLAHADCVRFILEKCPGCRGIKNCKAF